jgi:hypothetical protein
MMMELEDDDEWSQQDNTDDLTDIDTPSALGEQAIVCACRFPGSTVLVCAISAWYPGLLTF